MAISEPLDIICNQQDDLAVECNEDNDIDNDDDSSHELKTELKTVTAYLEYIKLYAFQRKDKYIFN